MRQRLIKVALPLFVCLMAAGGVSAQGIKDVRINEFLVKNVNSYEDGYGHREGWIELFNAGYAQVDVGGAYFKVNGKEYRIPKNDPNTRMAPQGYLIFFAEGTSSKGTFHTNFRLDETDFLSFYDQSGRVLVDSVSYDINAMNDDISVGWYETHDGEMHFGDLVATTPGAINDTEEKIPRYEIFREQDPTGSVMTVTAMSVVFTALLCMALVFFVTSLCFIWLNKRAEKRKQQRELAAAAGVVEEKKAKSTLSPEAMAAVAIALYKYSENLHDIENTVLTINRVARAYSPWSSKIYGLRETPTKSKR